MCKFMSWKDSYQIPDQGAHPGTSEGSHEIFWPLSPNVSFL